MPMYFASEECGQKTISLIHDDGHSEPVDFDEELYDQIVAASDQVPASTE